MLIIKGGVTFQFRIKCLFYEMYMPQSKQMKNISGNIIQVSEHQVQVLSVWSVWFLILNKKQVLFLVIKFPRTTFKYHSIVVFWCLALYQALWLCQESLRDTIRSPFLLLTPLLVSCVWRLFVTKIIMKCSLTKAWSISIYHFKAFIFTSPISRLGCNLL